MTPKGLGVPVFVHDHFGDGRHAKVVSTRAKDLLADGNKYKPAPPLTGNESVVAEVDNVEFPELLDPVDDLSPATVITHVRRDGDKTIVEGVTHDNSIIETVTVNGRPAKLTRHTDGVLDWRIELSVKKGGTVEAVATDRAGNVEQTPHQFNIP